MSATYRSRYEALVDALPERERRLLACDMARRALTRSKVEDPRSWEAVAVAERYADGLATLGELRAARAAARAARYAARDAAMAAAHDATGAAWAAWAAEDAAQDSARNAAKDAARAAAWAARDARAAARAAAEDSAYKMFFEWAMKLAIGEEVMA